MITPRWSARLGVALFALLTASSAACAQDTASVRRMGDSVYVRFVDADLRAVVQSLGSLLPKPMLAGGIPAVRVSFQTPHPVSPRALADLLRNLVQGQNLLYQEDSTSIRIGPKPPEPLPAPPINPGASASPLQLGAPASGGIELFVIRLRHARAADVAATVNQLYGAGGEFSGRAGLSTGTLSDELRRSSIPPGGGVPVAQAGGTRVGAASPAGGLSGPVVMVPDPLTNSLLVRATAADVQLLKQAIDQLDIRPLQVLLEVLIVEAQNDKSFSLGNQLFSPKAPGDSTGAVPTSKFSGALNGTGLGDVVVRLMGLAHGNIDASLTLAQSRGQVRIVSRPVLLTMNNAEARLLVGSQRPFVQVSRTLPTDNSATDQVVQYRDVGTKLSFRPTVNQDGYVSMVIQQEVSQATAETQFNAPIISTREAATQVLVKDGQTIMLGGLRDSQRERTQTGIPVLSWIPLIGGLFGSSSKTATSTEVFVFITPRILRNDEDVERLTRERMPKDTMP